MPELMAIDGSTIVNQLKGQLDSSFSLVNIAHYIETD